MGILKYVDRAKRMDDLIYRKATGTTQEFAQKLGISRPALMVNLRELKELGAPICYDEHLQTYYYDGDFNFFLRSKEAMRKIRGGKISSINFMGIVPQYPDDLYLLLS